MAGRLIWTDQAVDDVQAIAAFIERDSPAYAQRFVEQTLQLAESASQAPMLGRKVPEFDDTAVRERFLFSYRLIYRVSADAVTILGLIHGKRLLASVDDYMWSG